MTRLHRHLRARFILAALVRQEERSGHVVSTARREHLERDARLYAAGRLHGWPRESRDGPEQAPGRDAA